jgi:hypothetical protein
MQATLDKFLGDGNASDLAPADTAHLIISNTGSLSH